MILANCFQVYRFSTQILFPVLRRGLEHYTYIYIYLSLSLSLSSLSLSLPMLRQEYVHPSPSQDMFKRSADMRIQQRRQRKEHQGGGYYTEEAMRTELKYTSKLGF